MGQFHPDDFAHFLIADNISQYHVNTIEYLGVVLPVVLLGGGSAVGPGSLLYPGIDRGPPLPEPASMSGGMREHPVNARAVNPQCPVYQYSSNLRE